MIPGERLSRHDPALCPGISIIRDRNENDPVVVHPVLTDRDLTESFP